MGDITEIWVVDASGKCIYNYCIENNTDPNLIAGFFSAISQFGKNLSKKELNGIELGDEIILFKKIQDCDLLIIGKGKNTGKNAEMKEVMDQIVNAFKTRYPPKFLQSWNGDLEAFEDFTQLINQIFYEKGLNCMERYKSLF